MPTRILATGVLALSVGVGCDSGTDVGVRIPVQVNSPSLANDVDDVQAAALSAMFSADINGDVPSDRRYLAVMLFEKRTPDTEFLRRFATQDTEVITHAEGLSREPKDRGNEHQTAGLYVTIDSIDWVSRDQAAVGISVGNGWGAAIYRLQLRRDKANWNCIGIERTATS